MAFIGIKVPENVASYLSKIEVPGRKTPIEEMHITLLMLSKEAKISQVMKAIIGCYVISEMQKPFKVGTALVTTFPVAQPGETPIIARVLSDELHQFQKNMREKFDEIGVDYSKKFPEYKPHVTLSYNSGPHPNIKCLPTVWEINTIVVWGGDHGEERISTKIDLMGLKYVSKVDDMVIHIFGLTGGIATGKSTVAKRWRERGLVTIDADEISREAVRPGSIGNGKIRKEFGPGVFKGEELDRERMSDIIFNHPHRRKKLEEIMHPIIKEFVTMEAKIAESAGHTIACFDAALLFESGSQEMFKPIVVTHVPVEEQIKRMMNRTNMKEEKARLIIAAQMPSHKKIEMANFTINTIGSKSETKKVSDSVLDSILKHFEINVEQYPKLPNLFR